jgi:F0F1-type ATP synthase membrane subunit b/b'
VDAVFAGKINLANIANLVPLPEGTQLQGLLTSDLAAKGNMSTLDKGNYEAFEAKGSLQIAKLFYAATDLPKPFKINEASMNFTPKQVLLNNFDAAIGNSDFKLNGALENFYGYYLGNAILKGNLNLTSNTLDANEWLSEEPAAATEDTAAMSIVLLPENIDFQFNSNIQKLLYTNMEITNFKGGVHLANKQLDLQKITLDLLGSNMKLDGYYETKNPILPTMKIDFGIQNLDVQAAYKTFNTVKKLAPAAENISGKISTVFTMNSSLTSNMEPDLNTLMAEGYLSIPQAAIGNISALNKIAETLAKPEYKQLSVSNAKINWKVLNGRVFTEPFNVKMGNQNIELSGSTGLDQTIAYNGLINIPRKDLGAADAAINSAIKQFNSALGSDLKLNETLPLVVNIGGTFTKPEIKTNLKDLLSNQAGSLKDKALDEAKKKAKELEAKAREDAEKLLKDAEDKAKAEAQKLKSEAESKLNAEKEKLKKEAETKKKEAEAKAKAEADKLKKQAEEEGKKKLKGLLKP